MCPHYPIQPTIRHTPYTGSVCPSASDTPCICHSPRSHPLSLNQSGARCSAASALPARNLSGYASAAHQTCSSIAQRHAHMMPNWVRMRIRSLLHLPTPRWRCRRCGATRLQNAVGKGFNIRSISSESCSTAEIDGQLHFHLCDVRRHGSSSRTGPLSKSGTPTRGWSENR